MAILVPTLKQHIIYTPNEKEKEHNAVKEPLLKDLEKIRVEQKELQEIIS